MLGGGVVAAVSYLVTAIDWIGWIGENFASFDAIQFLIGLVASLVLARTGWRAYQESGRMGSAAPPPTKSSRLWHRTIGTLQASAGRLLYFPERNP